MNEIDIHQNKHDKKELTARLSERGMTWVRLSDDELKRVYPRMFLYCRRGVQAREMFFLLTFNEFDELAAFVAELRRREIVRGGR